MTENSFWALWPPQSRDFPLIALDYNKTKDFPQIQKNIKIQTCRVTIIKKKKKIQPCYNYTCIGKRELIKGSKMKDIENHLFPWPAVIPCSFTRCFNKSFINCPTSTILTLVLWLPQHRCSARAVTGAVSSALMADCGRRTPTAAGAPRSDLQGGGR